MLDNGHRRKKPSSEEVYQDAKKILDEYLKRKLQDGTYGHNNHGNGKGYTRSASYIKAASNERIVEDAGSGDVDGLYQQEDGFSRSKTMPSTFKSDGGPQERDSGGRDHGGSSKAGRYGRDSSPETDDDSDEEETKNRKKKSVFKRAAERLMHAFHWDSRSKDEDIEVHGHTKSKKKYRKKKKMKQTGKSVDTDIHDTPDMNNRHVKDTYAHIDFHISNVGDKHHNRSDKPTPPDRPSISLRRNSSGKKLLESIRKSFRKSKKKDISSSRSAEPVSHDERERSYSRSTSTPDRNSHLQVGGGSWDSTSSQGQRSRSSSHSADHQRDGKFLQRHMDRMSKMDVVISQSEDNHRPRTIQVHGLHIDNNNTPGIVKPHVPAGFLGSIEASVDINDRTEMVLGDDGVWEVSGTTQTRKTTTCLEETSIETDGISRENLHLDQVDSPTDPSQDDKDEAINRIVQKLIDIGDSLSAKGEPRGVSIAEGAVGGVVSSEQDSLSPLEREIMACLRSGGDTINGTASQAIDDTMKQAVFKRFNNALKQSVGDDVNWNQMVVVFQTAKSALKMVGTGTKIANQLKDLTVTFLTEKYASWIVDQGGWESIVSDTDSELD